jgi:hypothetical protein
MSKQDIIDLYDRKPDITLQQLARLTGYSIADLKRLLMS